MAEIGIDYTALNSTVAQTQATADQSALAADLNTFLELLTTQLQNQNPMEPMDSDQFTEQLVQYSGVEQQIQSNELLENLININSSQTATNIVGFIGNSITADGDVTRYQNNEATWYYDVPDNASNVQVSIRDALTGAIMHTEDLGFADPGRQTYTWDGTTSNGTIPPDGEYQITVTAEDADGTTYQLNTLVEGVVTGVDFETDEPYLRVGDTLISLSQLREVNTVSAV